MKDKLTPCILPWVSFGTNPFGKSRPCGYSALKSKKNVQTSTISTEFNNELFKSIRKDFLSGQWPTNCEKCKFTEETQPGHSKKVDSEVFNPRHFDLIDQTNADGSVDHYPKLIDIRLGTVCNLKCIHCGTGNSNKWLEDKEMLDKYPNTRILDVDNSWIDRESPIWEDIYEHLFEIEKFNFIGGEPFASVKHNRFIEEVSKTEHAKNIAVHYVTNGVLLTDRLWEVVQRFKEVCVNVSLDATGDALEFFRYPIKAKPLHEKLKKFEETKGDHVDLSLQWTSSNISLFYLPQTLDYFEENFKKINFRMCNYVTYPAHMSAQNLPPSFKKVIFDRLTPYLDRWPSINLYLTQMMADDLWEKKGHVLFNYLEDLNNTRNLEWRTSLSEWARELEGLWPDPPMNRSQEL